RSNLWASGYDVDGTDQTSLGQFSGRVQQTYKHSVPRFFVPERGTMFTLALVRFPPTATKEIQYLNAKGALTYTDIAGDPVLYGNLPPREISMKDVFRSGELSKKFKIAEGQWYRYAPSYVSRAYHLLEGFPFIQEPPSGDLQERVLIRHHDYDQWFQSVQLLQWNSQVKFNVTFFFSSRRRHTRSKRDWSSDVCSSDLAVLRAGERSADRNRRREPPVHTGRGRQPRRRSRDDRERRNQHARHERQYLDPDV